MIILLFIVLDIILSGIAIVTLELYYLVALFGLLVVIGINLVIALFLKELRSPLAKYFFINLIPSPVIFMVLSVYFSQHHNLFA